jgi:GT2 family glycosyltransferase
MSLKSSIIILSWNGRAYLERCISVILRQIDETSEILLVDNASSDGSADFVRARFPHVIVIQNSTNLGVAAGWNVGIAHAKGQILFFLNQDVFVREGWLSQMEQAMNANRTIGIAGCKLLYPDEITIQHAGAYILYPLGLTEHRGLREFDEGQYEEELDVDYVTGAAFGVKRYVLDSIGTFDPMFYPAYYEDVDFCVRARTAGFQVIYVPKATAIHYHSASLGKDSEAFYYSYHRNRLRFIFKYLPTDQFEEFRRQETLRLTSGLPVNELKALRRVYPEDFVIDNNRKDEVVKVILEELVRSIPEIPSSSVC